MMQNELLEIIRKEYKDHRSLNDIVEHCYSLFEFIDKQKAFTTEKFKKFLDKYNFKTISRFSEYHEYPYVTLGKARAKWNVFPGIEYNNVGFDENDSEIGVLLHCSESDYAGEENATKISLI